MYFSIIFRFSEKKQLLSKLEYFEVIGAGTITFEAFVIVVKQLLLGQSVLS